MGATGLARTESDGEAPDATSRRSAVRYSDPREVAVKTAKDEVRELLDNLPDDASLEDIQYHLYVRQKIQLGLAAAEQGRTIPHEEVVRRMSRWLEK